MASKRALIVDDSTTAQYRLKKMLRLYPLDIDIVDSGEAALRYLAHQQPDVIFMDHLMPGMDGFRALQIIKSHPETAMIPVIMYTSKSGDVYTGQARALGALDVVSKDTINATDLSRVMETIHIYPQAKGASDSHSDALESPELIAAANKVSDSPAAQLERRAAAQAAIEQARNLELRLSHMEHSLEDSRRFITARVSRELQGLRTSLQQEISHIVQQQPPAPAEPAQTLAVPSRSPWGLTLMIALGFLVGAYLLLEIRAQLSQSQDQQAQLMAQLDKLEQRSGAAHQAETTLGASANQAQLAPAARQISQSAPSTAADQGPNYLEDLAWSFNQQGQLAFRQYTIDTSAVLRLHELLYRLTDRGFKGTAAITLYVGDFCIAKDSQGMDQLAPAESNLSNCMLSSELYGIERLQADYQRETEMILRNLTGSINSTLKVDIQALVGTEAYPERLPTLSAGEWNAVAQKNNRIELALLETD